MQGSPLALGRFAAFRWDWPSVSVSLAVGQLPVPPAAGQLSPWD